MSGAMPDDRDLLAAEYVLGTLSAAEAEAVLRALPDDRVLAEAVAGWERRLAPLTHLAPPQSPPPDLWSGIERHLAPVTPAPRVPPAWMDRVLRWWAAGATAAAIAATALLVLRPPGPVPLAAVMVTDRSQPAWIASFGDDGALRVTAVTPAGGEVPRPPSAGVLQLWVLAPGATAPTSLAILAPGQTGVVLRSPAVRPVPGMLIELTLEPAGGSPLPRPSGPVQFIGRLAQAT